jgi:hypothetical protein
MGELGRMSLLSKFAGRTANAIARRMVRTENWQDLMMLQGVQAALLLRETAKLETLGDAEFKVFSQWGEDGIIEWLISRLPGIPETFIEFGVEDYTEANTRFLLRHRNWRGLIMDGSKENMESARQGIGFWRHDLTAKHAFITRDNINALLQEEGFTGEVGILSVDIDGNDYWVWEAINVVQPWIVIAEYNAVFGDLRPLTIPYDATYTREAGHPSLLYFGASVAALSHLGEKKGYRVVGSNRAGNNLFLVRADIAAPVESAIRDRRPRPSLYAEARNADGSLSFARGLARSAAIGDMAVYDVARAETVRLADAGDLYSPHWRALMGCPAQPG